MDKNKLELVPEVVLDVVRSIYTTKNEFMRECHIMRLEAIAQFCNEELSNLKVPEKTK